MVPRDWFDIIFSLCPSCLYSPFGHSPDITATTSSSSSPSSPPASSYYDLPTAPPYPTTTTNSSSFTTNASSSSLLPSLLWEARMLGLTHPETKWDYVHTLLRQQRSYTAAPSLPPPSLLSRPRHQRPSEAAPFSLSSSSIHLPPPPPSFTTTSGRKCYYV